MKKMFHLLVVFLMGACIEKDAVFEASFYACKSNIASNNLQHSLANTIDGLAEHFIDKGVPGIMISVRNKEGQCTISRGKSDLASDIDLKPCNITRVGSTVKTFTAVTILMLQEDGLLNLDDPLSKYLSKTVYHGIENAEKSTIRQLLNHSSGIHNYIQDPGFQTASLNDLIKEWQPEELLEYSRGRDAYFPIGADVKYSNTNYIFLGIIIEEVTGIPFYQVFEEKLFRPMNLSFTSFAATDPVPDGIIRGYVDLYSNLNLINATYYSGWDYFSADGGLLSNTSDLSLFMIQLFQGKILSEASLREMMNWIAPKYQDENGFETFYGPGIFKIITDYGPAYLHSGDAIGYFASMLYFPDQGVAISWASNANYGKIDNVIQSKETMEWIFEAILK
ncbi:MAG: serine hydrolase domain-containing protein [Bacteroidota bacterium]